jgi:hypothetical protein
MELQEENVRIVDVKITNLIKGKERWKLTGD